MKIRHYGLLRNRNKTATLRICKQHTSTPLLQNEKTPIIQLIQKIVGKTFSKCPQCGLEKLNNYNSFGKPPPATIKTA